MPFSRVVAEGRVLTSSRVLIDSIDSLRPKFQFRADNVTLSGGNVATIPNMRGSDSLVMTSGTLAAPTADVLFGGSQSATFTGTQWLDSNLPSSSWRFLHDGSGYELFEISVSTTNSLNVHWATIGGGAAVGAQVFASSGSLTNQTNNGVSSIINAVATNGSILNTASYYNIYYGENTAPEFTFFAKEVVSASGSSTGAPNPSSTAGTFRLGAQPSNAFPAQMRWAETLIFDRVLSEYERQVVREYIQTRYGITAPVVTGDDREILSMNPFSQIRADYYNTSGGNVTGWNDRVRPGHIFSQATTMRQILIPTVDGSFNGQLTATFNGSDKWYSSNLSASAWSFIHLKQSEVFCVFCPTSNASLGVIFATRPSSGAGIVVYRTTGGVMTHLINSGAGTILNSGFGTTTINVPTYVECSFDNSLTPKVVDYIKGSSTVLYPSGPVGSAVAGSSFLLGSDGVSASTMRWAETLIFNRILTEAERAIVRRYIFNRYGISP